MEETDFKEAAVHNQVIIQNTLNVLFLQKKSTPFLYLTDIKWNTLPMACIYSSKTVYYYLYYYYKNIRV
jgi:hypothetical protein